MDKYIVYGLIFLLVLLILVGSVSLSTRLDNTNERLDEIERRVHTVEVKVETMEQDDGFDESIEKIHGLIDRIEEEGF